jgi:hypothetical protein
VCAFVWYLWSTACVVVWPERKDPDRDRAPPPCAALCDADAEDVKAE